MAVDLKMMLPEWFKDILEFNQLLETEEVELEAVENSIRSVRNNCFIQTADENTISLYEKRFGISYQGETLDYRKSRILQRYNTVVPFTIGFLKNRLSELYGSDGYILSVNSKTCLLTIKVTSDRYGALNLLYDLLWDIIPAHIRIIASQEAQKYIKGGLYIGTTMSSTKITTI
ncbi:putative phage tail protein [Clostridium sp. HBUAS56010]|uniref:putative phage tail protein n=1 Tax=Clostridium sp. HBUAS56010 TaxID=2571127 RepID=UPI0011780192|nr:putative phage tail protein [Clostridium sp. HBUAS56010]